MAVSAEGRICTRTADFSAPLMITWLTPSTWLSRWPITSSAAWNTSSEGRVSEVIPMTRMGESAGLNLR